MKTIFSSCHLMRRLALLLCTGFLVVASPSPVEAKEKKRDKSAYHHPNSRYRSQHSRQRSRQHSRDRANYERFHNYNPGYGYYQGYYDEYPHYSPGYRGRRYYNNSNYGRNPHNSLLIELYRHP